MATVVVDQAKLVMNAFAAIFQNNLVSAEICSWKQYDGEFNDRNALTIVEQVGPRYDITTTTDGVKDLTAGVQDTVFGSEQFKINKTFGSSMGWGDFVKIRDIGDARESEAIKNAAVNLAEKIDAYVLSVCTLASNNWVGTAPGSNVDSFGEFMSAYTRLKENGVDDSDLRAILTYNDQQAMGEYITALPAPDALATDSFRGGFSGKIGGIPTMFTQQLPTLTVGTRVASGASQVDGAAENVDYSDVSVSTAPGRYKTQTLSIKNLTGTKTIKAGEVFTIANVNAWDNRLGASLGRLQQFTVVADATSSSGNVDVIIYPAIIVPGSGSGGDIAVNTANATVDSVPADSAAITWIGVASTAYKPRLVIQKEAVVVNTVPLIMPATGIGTTKALTKVPLSVRMWQNSDFNTGAHSVRFDVALTANIRSRDRVVRLNGNT